MSSFSGHVIQRIYDLSCMKEERWNMLISLDEELLKGGVILSEWCSFIVREADFAFVGGAHLATILTTVSGIETFLRSEFSTSKKERLVDLINCTSFNEELKNDLHKLRQYRNKWVHVDEPWNDDAILDAPDETKKELEIVAFFAVRTLRKIIYQNQWI